MANPQAVSRLLGRSGVPTILWSDRFKVEGVSAQRGAEGSVTVTVDFRSRAVRDVTEMQVIAALVGAGYRVTGAAGLLRVSDG